MSDENQKSTKVQIICLLSGSVTVSKCSTKECANHWTVVLISHTSKVMLKILYAILQPYVNQELPYVQAGFRNGRMTRDQIATICCIIEKGREFQKNIYHCFNDYAKALTVWNIANCGKLLRRWEYQTILHVSWETYMQAKKQQLGPVWNNWLVQDQERNIEDCLLSSFFFNLYREHIMRNARLDELQAGIKTSRRNINNLRYLDDTTLMAESEQELKNILMEWRRRAGLKLNIKKDRIIASDLIQFSSVTQLCPIICDPMDCSTSGFPVHLQLLELAQTHAHWVSDAIQSSYPVIPFSSCLQSFPASGSFPISQFFAPGG